RWLYAIFVNNKDFVPHEKIELDKIVVHMKNADKFYGHAVQRTELTYDDVGQEFDGRSWIVNMRNLKDPTDEWLFLIVKDNEKGWYVSHLHIGRITDDILYLYKKAKGIPDVEKKETRVVRDVLDAFTFYFSTIKGKELDRVVDSRSS